MTTTLNTPFAFSSALYSLTNRGIHRTATQWVSELPGRLHFSTVAIDHDAKVLTVQVYCPGRFDEGFEATARFDTCANMHADVAKIQDGVRAEKVASDARMDAMNARLDAEFEAARAVAYAASKNV